MKKFAMALGAAAVAVVSGCKDPNYKREGAGHVQNDVKNADTAVVQPQAGQKPITVAVKQCTCAPGTRHTSPCACGGANCFCIVEQKPVAPAPVATRSAEPEFTVYVVRSGDYLAKISKRFNVTIASIKRLNKMTNNVVRVGQKLKIPGNVDVGPALEPPKATAAAPKAAKSYTPYAGATKELVVKNGDTLGSIALASGISIRQLKELNGLTNDVLRVGQKLKVPAAKVEKKAAEKTAKAEAKVEKKAAVAATKAPDAKAAEKAAEPVEAPAEANKAADAEPATAVADATAAATTAAESAAAATSTYVVQEGDDITGISIRFGVSAAEIRALNNLGESDQIKPGQIIKLPAEAQQ